MNDSRIPVFPGINSPSTDFAAVRDGRRARVFHYDVDLTNARSIAAGTHLILPLAANSFFSDQSASQGNATVYFQDLTLNPTDAPPIYVGPGFVAEIPFTTLLIEHTAQPGKRLRFFYGVDIDFKPSLSGTILISGSVNTAAVSSLITANASGNAFNHTASYKSTTNMAALTPDTVFAPGANLNGAIIWNANLTSVMAAANRSALLTKTSAPVSLIDGDVVLSTVSNGAGVPNTARLQNFWYVAAGRGLYFISENLETLAQRDVLFTLI